MTRSRWLPALAAAALAVVAVVWIVGALEGNVVLESAGGDEAAEKTADEQGIPPRWEEFVETSGKESPPARPVVALEDDGEGVQQPDPFERTQMRRRLRGVALRLEGVALGDDPKALVSGQVVRLGDVVEGFRAARIDASGITLVGPVGGSLELVIGEAASPPAEAAVEPEHRWRNPVRQESEELFPRTRKIRP